MSARGSRDAAACDALIAWLRRNLGRDALAALTGTDARALSAAVHIIELYTCSAHPSVLRAFGDVVLEMQPSTRYLAYHSIAYVREWDDRAVIWNLANLPYLGAVPRCDGER